MRHTSLLDALFTHPYGVMLLAGLILLVSVWLLVFRRKNLPPVARWVLVLLILLCVLYFAAVVWLAIGFGRNAHPPTPTPGG